MSERTSDGAPGLLLMGYGSPSGPEDLPGFLAEVLGGRTPSAAMVAEYTRRYDLIGWSPQMRILEALRGKVEARLAALGTPAPVYLATKHWTPHIADVIPRAAEDGIERLVAVPISPYASTWILAPYERAIASGRANSARPIEVELRSGWHLHPAWIGYWTGAIRRSVRPGPDAPMVFLSAHSLPERMRTLGDPYPELVRATARTIAEAAGLARWEFTYQSAGNTTEPWLGPDITERIEAWSSKGRTEQWIAPIGFVFEHLEVLYDLDVLVREFAESRGVPYHRLPMPNSDDALVEAIVATAGRSRRASDRRRATPRRRRAPARPRTKR